MKAIVLFLFGPSWKSSLVGLGVGLATAVVTYAQAQPQPGWYLVAIGFAALGRLVKDADKSNAPEPVATSVKVP
jgi:hypothetical protein